MTRMVMNNNNKYVPIHTYILNSFLLNHTHLHCSMNQLSRAAAVFSLSLIIYIGDTS